MNVTTACTLYPNRQTDIRLQEKHFSILWNPEEDEIVISKAKSRKSKIYDPEKFDLVGDPNYPRSQSTYSVNLENSQLRLKYMDGHRVQSIIVE